MLLLSVFAPPRLASASDLYSYEDENGVLHLTNLTDAVRRQRRKGWKPFAQAGSEGFGGEVPVVLELKGKKRVLYPVDVGRYDHHFAAAAAHYRLPFALLKAVAKVESNFDARAVSRADAKGLMQLIDSTAARMNVTDPFDPRHGTLDFRTASWMALSGITIGSPC